MTNDTVAGADTGVVRSVFAAFAGRDIAAIGELFHQDATWNHRNRDRLGGFHHGSDGIVAFLAESAQLTGGTLRPVPRSFPADGEGRVAVLVQVSGSRPDGRSFDTPRSCSSPSTAAGCVPSISSSATRPPSPRSGRKEPPPRRTAVPPDPLWHAAPVWPGQPYSPTSKGVPQ